MIMVMFRNRIEILIHLLIGFFLFNEFKCHEKIIRKWPRPDYGRQVLPYQRPVSVHTISVKSSSRPDLQPTFLKESIDEMFAIPRLRLVPPKKAQKSNIEFRKKEPLLEMTYGEYSDYSVEEYSLDIEMPYDGKVNDSNMQTESNTPKMRSTSSTTPRVMQIKAVRSSASGSTTTSKPSGKPCKEYTYPYIYVKNPPNCVYGKRITYVLTIVAELKNVCSGDWTWKKSGICQFCFQAKRILCPLKYYKCSSVSTPLSYYETQCQIANINITCFGPREFNRLMRCNWAGTRRYYTAMVLSLTLGGLGADRFYLGMWKEGFAKMLTFGGLGFWSLIDAFLIIVRQMGPIDGSLFVDYFYLHWTLGLDDGINSNDTNATTT